MFYKASYIQKMARILREMKRPPAEEGTDELVDQYKEDTPGQGEEVEEHCGVCGQGIGEVGVDEAPKGTPKPKVEKSKSGFQVMVWSPKGKKYIPQGQPHKNEKDAEKDAKSFEEVEVAESFELQATMALDDAGIKSKWKKGKLYVAKRDIKKAEKALGKSFKRMKKGAEPDLYYEEVELDEKGTAYPATVDTLRKIVKDKQHQTVMFKSGQALVDLFTASAIIAVYDGMKKPELKKKLEDMIKTKEGFLRTQSFAMKMVK